MLATSDIQQILAITEQAGKYITEQSISLNDVEEKSRNSLVTFVDKNAEKILVDGFSKIIDNASFLTEEETVEEIQGTNYRWIIDPLDGTTNFIHGIPCYCVSIALQFEEETVFGAIYDPNREEMFYASKGKGAFLNNKPIFVTQTEKLEDVLLATGFPYYDYGRMEAYILLFQDFMKSTRGLRRLGSAAIDLAYVACGRCDGFYEYSLNPWDVAAGVLIVEEAGGKVSDFSGGKDYLFGKEIVASNSVVFNEFLSKIKHYF